MESITEYLNKHRKTKTRAKGTRNGKVIHIAMSIDQIPKPLRRKALCIPQRELNIEYYTPIEVPYTDKNGDEKVYREPEFKDLPLNIQRKEQRRTSGMSKITDMEILYNLYGR